MKMKCFTRMRLLFAGENSLAHPASLDTTGCSLLAVICFAYKQLRKIFCSPCNCNLWTYRRAQQQKHWQHQQQQQKLKEKFLQHRIWRHLHRFNITSYSKSSDFVHIFCAVHFFLLLHILLLLRCFLYYFNSIFFIRFFLLFLYHVIQISWVIARSE